MIETLDTNTASQIKDADFEMLRKLVYEKSGIRLTPEKKFMVEARLRKRIRELKLQDLDEYFRYLSKEINNQEEIVSLLNVISTNKTDFYREPDHFKYMVNTILPEFMKSDKHTQGSPFKVWCAASSTGEEPYTLAFLLKEFQAQEPSFRFGISASDISTKVLKEAFLGIYEKEKADDIPHEIQQKYLLKGKDKKAGFVRIAPEIRKLVRFFRLNLKDPVYDQENGLDLIFCRNVLIYFDKDLQQEVITKLSKHLKPGGYLITGHSETLSGMDTPVKRITSTIYQK